MATIGVRRPYVAKYNYDESTGTVTYSDGAVFARAIEFGSNIDAPADNDLYADDGIAESDRSFSSGTINTTVDEITQEASALILGITPTPITVGETEGTELIFGESVEPPDLGFGIIITKKHRGVLMYRAVVFPKVKFNIPSDAATTQGQTIEWQTPALEATIMRDDTAARKWKREATWDSEAQARAYIEQILEITPEV